MAMTGSTLNIGPPPGAGGGGILLTFIALAFLPFGNLGAQNYNVYAICNATPLPPVNVGGGLGQGSGTGQMCLYALAYNQGDTPISKGAGCPTLQAGADAGKSIGSMLGRH